MDTITILRWVGVILGLINQSMLIYIVYAIRKGNRETTSTIQGRLLVDKKAFEENTKGLAETAKETLKNLLEHRKIDHEFVDYIKKFVGGLDTTINLIGEDLQQWGIGLRKNQEDVKAKIAELPKQVTPMIQEAVKEVKAAVDRVNKGTGSPIDIESLKILQSGDLIRVEKTEAQKKAEKKVEEKRQEGVKEELRKEVKKEDKEEPKKEG
jgi:hypothetical protein